MANAEYVKGRAHSEELWAEVRRAVEAGETFRNVEKLYGIGYATVSKRAKREGWLVIGGGRLEREEERARRSTEESGKVAEIVKAEAEAIREVKLELVNYGERMRGVGLRTKRKMVEMVERTLAEVEEGKLSTKDRASVLRDLAAVGKVLHRWDRESVEEEVERGRRGAINLGLIRVPPELLRGE
jgi:NAD(P)-dependent dehydrogenase (short-subunit alcohol dehydrogenase family)